MPNDPELDPVVANELALLDPAVRGSTTALTALLDEEFREFASSGQVWDRDSLVAALRTDPGESGAAAAVEDMRAMRLAPDLALLTYVVRRPTRTTLRSSLWRRHGSGWTLLFHQGTPRH